ncbi:MAG: hypothetical protein WC464_07345 [Bdellovibrionales bacterium]
MRTCIKSSLLIILFSFLVTSALARDNSASVDKDDHFAGTYKSVDNKFIHIFAPSGDYEGAYEYSNKVRQVSGAYKQGQGVCSTENRGAGNVMLFYDKEQCCLRLERISNKLVVTVIGYSYTNLGEGGMCQNHVLVKTN